MYDSTCAQAAAKSLSEWLASYAWDYWFTATSKDKDSCKYPTVAIERASRSLRGLNRGFVGAEPHYLGGWHTHGLIALSCDPGAKEGVRRDIEHDLSRFGFTRVEQARTLNSVTTYLTKYVTKERTAEWTIIGRIGWWYDKGLQLPKMVLK